jgi:5S rRNA maturation endonuclease (ribonuclease M5)
MIYDTDKVIEVLSLEEILKHTTEYDIYSYYLGSKFEVGKIMSSPFRQDLKPSFGIFKTKGGTMLLWKDQGTGECGNVMTFVKKYKDLYRNSQALKAIWEEVVKGNIQFTERGKQINNFVKTTKTIISIKRRNFSDTDDVYWSKYGITRETLKKFNVYPISFFWVNDIQQSLVYSKNSPLYAYKIFDKFKIYRPLSEFKKDKWRTNCSNIDLQGYEQLPKSGETLIITKSLKDVMVLYNLGYNAVSLQSENDHINKDILTDLQNRFNKIIVFFDNDKPGQEASNKLCEEHDLKQIRLDSSLQTIYQVKDISDYFAMYGLKKTVEQLKSLVDGLVWPKEKVS